MVRPWLAPAALGVALLSLLLNVGLLWQITHPERWIAPAVERATGIGIGADGVLRYDVTIPAGTPLNLDIPVSERFAVRVDTVLPINTRVRVPFNTPFGNSSVMVPIRADVPLRTALPLNIQHTFRLRTRTTVPISVPIQLKVR
ncbi:MAG: hypothetical protein KY464_03645 [Gemmatimonadetes bacterium]|nr:hypothetical protein [Gemmatimonadota bacterium]